MEKERNAFLCTRIYTLDRNTVKNLDFMFSQVTHIPQAAGMKTAEEEVTAWHSYSVRKHSTREVVILRNVPKFE